MKVLFLDSPLVIYLKPRIYNIDISDVAISLRNEMTGEILEPNISMVLGEYLEITILNKPAAFKSQQKYEIVVFAGDELIYTGKLIILETGTDIQNYEYESQSTARFNFKK